MMPGSRSTSTDATSVLVARWLRNLDPEGSCPRFGSPEWLRLPPTDRRRTAAVVRAAEAWRRHCSREQVTLDLIEQLQREDDSIRRRVREASWQVAGALDWGRLADTPTHDELRERRAAS